VSGDEPAVRSVRGRAPFILIAVLVLLCVSRLAFLGAKLPHHDEMVHVELSERLAFDGTYRASPAYHGPLLYHLEAGVFRVFGSGLWQARLVPALAGLAAALALVGLAWRESGARVALAVAVLVTLSPSWLYYSRFNAHDSLILLTTTLVAWGRWHWTAGRLHAAVWLVTLALALAWSTKLNALFVAGAIVLWPLAWRLTSPEHATTNPRRWPRPRLAIAAIAGSLMVVGVLFLTTLQSYWQDTPLPSALGATVRAALSDPVRYWTSLHRQERLGGPFHYYGAMLALYEPLLVAGIGLALVGAWRHRARPWVLAATALLSGLVLAIVLWPWATVVRTVLHLHLPHVVLLPLATLAVWTLARARGRAGDAAGVWWVWMAATQSVLYGYAGEKVPWLTVHVALPWFMVAAPALTAWWNGGGALTRALATTLALLTAYGGLAVTTWTRNDVAEPLLQVEYTREAQDTLARVSQLCARVVPAGGRCLVTTPEAQWPARWYLRDTALTAVAVELDALDASTPFAFLPVGSASKGSGPASALPGSHEVHRVRFAAWGTWVEWLHRPTAQDLMEFWMLRRSLGPRRGAPYELWVRRDLHAPWNATLERAPTRAGRTR
jgi:uncharacterized protein (TIGR03663 family)